MPTTPSGDPRRPHPDDAAVGPARVAGSSVRPKGVFIIAGIVVLEALALLAVAAWYVYELFESTPLSYGGAVFFVVLVLLLAAGLLAVGHFLFRGYRWPRSAVLVWQLFMVLLAVTTMTSGQVLIGWAMLLPAVIVLILLFTKDVIAYTSRTSKDGTVL